MKSIRNIIITGVTVFLLIILLQNSTLVFAKTPPKTSSPLSLVYNFKTGIPAEVTGRGPVTISKVQKKSSPCVYVSGRTEGWHGIQIELTNKLKVGKEYRITLYVLQTEQESETINASFDITKVKKRLYPVISTIDVKKNSWVKINRKVRVEAYDTIFLYLQTLRNNTTSFYVKNIRIEEVVYHPSEVLSYPSLYQLADKYNFYLGTVISEDTLSSSPFRQVVKKHFNSMTAENEMKATRLLDHEKSMINAKSGNGMPCLDFSKADIIMDFAAANNIRMRGHTLIYQAATPDWFFREGYKSDSKYVDRSVMLNRMENYIMQVVTHFEKKYPEVIYAWDVVNEAIGIDIWDTEPKGDYPISMGLQTDLFYTKIGADYIQKAFEYARKYSSEGVKLFYNDWGCTDPTKRDAICYLINMVNKDEKLIDGIGMQCYLEKDSGPLLSYLDKSEASFVDAVDAFHELDMEIHLTEVTIKNYSISEYQTQGAFYSELFKIIKDINKDEAVITCVSFWSTLDRDQQVGDPGYPEWQHSGLLSIDLQPKPGFIEVYNSLNK
ncbi:MAG: hypothetical protein H6Q59_2050 [Firmicutes bacterium]|nr:hypothetical protein [Bacillota bacterium]